MAVRLADYRVTWVRFLRGGPYGVESSGCAGGRLVVVQVLRGSTPPPHPTPSRFPGGNASLSRRSGRVRFSSAGPSPASGSSDRVRLKSGRARGGTGAGHQTKGGSDGHALGKGEIRVRSPVSAPRARSSTGRAPVYETGGCRFDPCRARYEIGYDVGVKICAACKKKKRSSEFTKNKSRADGLNHSCKPCHRLHTQQHYKENKSYYLAKARRTQKNVQEMIRSMKRVPCIDCKRTFGWWVMDFDHVRGKKCFDLSLAHRRSGKHKALLEAAKCDIVCANCHRDRTHARR